ncbi:HAD family hydrolase [Taklimakanibacter lacteus]|uniref:HAD family hydrolase n=1 Tax=Taklimakanibacter lacteus TaxID=2268456 RepID=UPI000E667018
MHSDSAVIFDVDGVLLDLTAAEEDAFFWAFEKLHRLTGLSRDWDSYRTRNDEDIITEILEGHFGRAPSPAEHKAVIETYLAHLTQGIEARRLVPEPIEGAATLLASLGGRTTLGVATANLIEAAAARLAACGLWEPLKDTGFGANGGGAKREILARAMARLGLPRDRIVFIGDNLNDVAAGLGNGVHFIGFSLDEEKCRRLAAAGAQRICNHHQDTLKHIEDALKI